MAQSRKKRAKPAREGRFDYFLVEATGISEPLSVAEPRLGRRSVLFQRDSRHVFGVQQIPISQD